MANAPFKTGKQNRVDAFRLVTAGTARAISGKRDLDVEFGAETSGLKGQSLHLARPAAGLW